MALLLPPADDRLVLAMLVLGAGFLLDFLLGICDTSRVSFPYTFPFPKWDAGRIGNGNGNEREESTPNREQPYKERRQP